MMYVNSTEYTVDRVTQNAGKKKLKYANTAGLYILFKIKDVV